MNGSVKAQLIPSQSKREAYRKKRITAILINIKINLINPSSTIKNSGQ